MLMLAGISIIYGGPSPVSSSAHTLAGPEFQGVALFESLVVAAVGTETRQWQVHSAVKLQFLRDNPEGFGALLATLPLVVTLYRLTDNVICHIFNVIG